MNSLPPLHDRFERLDWAERWIVDAFDVAAVPASFVTIEVDMSRCLSILADAARNGHKATPTALFLRAAALALTRRPQLHRMIVGRRRYIYDRVDLVLSVASEGAMAPRLMLRDAGNKTWPELAEEVRAGAPRARDDDAAEMAFLRRWGWIAPFAWLRRRVLRRLRTMPGFRDRKIGTFQVSVLRDVDLFVALQFGTPGILTAGEVRDRVIAVNGEPTVRPTVLLTCSFNHKVWNGMDARTFLLEVAAILADGKLEAEAPAALVSEAAR